MTASPSMAFPFGLYTKRASASPHQSYPSISGGRTDLSRPHTSIPLLIQRNRQNRGLWFVHGARLVRETESALMNGVCPITSLSPISARSKCFSSFNHKQTPPTLRKLEPDLHFSEPSLLFQLALHTKFPLSLNPNGSGCFPPSLSLVPSVFPTALLGLPAE